MKARSESEIRKLVSEIMEAEKMLNLKLSYGFSPFSVVSKILAKQISFSGFLSLFNKYYFI